ncbi:ion transport domain-containing protein [Tanacetum coccineum]|uniref:Ion transport domain-containing protein n=1 Tax=Tanacetum coccineum TaxID=301880 RepID=A0ABQ5B6E8_9ASTR
MEASYVSTPISNKDWILLSVGQDEFHSEAVDTLNYVVNQSDYTVQTLVNITGYLALAKTINVEQSYLPSNVKDSIEKLNIYLNKASDTLGRKTHQNSLKIRTEDGSLTGSTSTYAKEHVAEIRRTKFSIGGEPNPLTEDLHHTGKNMSAELYPKHVHCFMELIKDNRKGSRSLNNLPSATSRKEHVQVQCANACLQMQAANAMFKCNVHMQSANTMCKCLLANAMYKCNVHMQAANTMCKLQ